MIHRSSTWRGRAKAGSDSQLHVQLSRDSEAGGPSAEPVFQGWGAGGASSAASSSHWHDFLGSRARKDLKTELQPSNKFQLCLWEEALLAWPLVPCPYTSRRREQLRWMHIPRLSSWPVPAAMLWMEKLGARRWAESRCTSSVFVCVCARNARVRKHSAASWGWKCKVRWSWAAGAGREQIWGRWKGTGCSISC